MTPTTSVTPALRIGLIGAGGFARFVLGVTHSLPGVVVTRVYDEARARAETVATASGALVAESLDELLDDVNAVLIATPPSTHAALALRALGAGRHVFCEKPMALSDADAAAIREAVERTGLTYVVDHVIRYNPLVRLLARLRAGGTLGAVQRFVFENDAGDSELGPDHWFWDADVSGGIFLEHGVHFFDVAEMIVGAPPAQVQALAARRPDGRIDTVVATVRHEGGALATHAHGFSHPNHAERQLMRVDFGLAEARLDGWIPLSLVLQAWVGEPGLAALRAVVSDAAAALALPGYRSHANQAATIEVAHAPAEAVSRDMVHTAGYEVTLEVQLGTPQDKQAVYAESVRAALSDFVGCVATGQAPSGGAAGASTVAVAAAATRAIDSGRTEAVGAWGAARVSPWVRSGT